MVSSIVKTIAGILVAAIFLIVFFFVFNAVTDWQAMVSTTNQLASFAQAVESSRMSDESFELTLPSIVSGVKFVQKSDIACTAATASICWDFWTCRHVESCAGGGEECECSIAAKDCKCFYDKAAFDYCRRITDQNDAAAFIYVNFLGKSPVCVETKNPITTKLFFFVPPEYAATTTTLPDQDISENYPKNAEQGESYVMVPPQLDGCYRYSMKISTKYDMTTVNIEKKSWVCGVWDSVSKAFK